MIRQLARETLREVMRERSRSWSRLELASSAVVFAPHPDDETLGCGATIAEKTSRGARVDVVCLTDGRSSHARWMDGDALAVRRREELLEAAARLGVSRERVHSLGFRDGELSESIVPAAERVADLLEELSPRQVFVPHAADPPPDHRATHRVVTGALRSRPQESGGGPTVVEYPVWLYDQWPFVPVYGRTWRSRCRSAVAAARGLPRFVRDFDVSTPVSTNHGRKRHALAAHRSQTQRFEPDWPVLADVASGDFLDCFFAEPEYFRLSVLGVERSNR